MNGYKFVAIIIKYKRCLKCGSSWKTTDLYHELHDEVVTIGCKCGWKIKVDENNKEVQ